MHIGNNVSQVFNLKNGLGIWSECKSFSGYHQRCCLVNLFSGRKLHFRRWPSHLHRIGAWLALNAVYRRLSIEHLTGWLKMAWHCLLAKPFASTFTVVDNFNLARRFNGTKLSDTARFLRLLDNEFTWRPYLDALKLKYRESPSRVLCHKSLANRTVILRLSLHKWNRSSNVSVKLMVLWIASGAFRTSHLVWLLGETDNPRLHHRPNIVPCVMLLVFLLNLITLLI